MSPSRCAMLRAMAKTFTIGSKEGLEIISQVEILTQKIRERALQGDADAADQLREEAEALIRRLGGKGSVDKRTELQTRIEAAIATPANALAVVKDFDRLRDEGASAVVESIRLAGRLSEHTRRLAEILLEIRQQIPRDDGLPDLTGSRRASKEAAAAIYREAAERAAEQGLLRDEDEARQLVGMVARSTQNQMTRHVLPRYIASLNRDETEARKYEPVLRDGEPPSQAVLDAYGLQGQTRKRVLQLEAAEGEAREEAVTEAEAQSVLASLDKIGASARRAVSKADGLSPRDRRRVLARLEELADELVELADEL